MLVLGITDGITCGASVVRDGSIVAAVHEERLARLKMAYGFPVQSIAEVLALAGVSPREVDRVAVATRNNHFFAGVRPFDGWMSGDKGIVRNTVFTTAGRLSYLVDRVPGLEDLYYRARAPIFMARRRAIRRILDRSFGIGAAVEFVDHHFAHATSAYFTSGFDDATVITMDGGGDGASSHVYRARDGMLERIAVTSAFNSLANYYAYVTHICGYKAQKHEGKITGLAAYGEPIYRELLDTLITLRNGELRNVGGRVFMAAVQDMERRLPKGWRAEDLSASIQSHCERIATAYLRQHLLPGRSTNIAIAGGLFANVRINQEMHETEGVDRLFVHPAMTDCGLATGAALASCVRGRPGAVMQASDRVLDDVYLGRGYSAAEIERELGATGLQFVRVPRIERSIAELLAQGYVVARFDGRMEYGPRALGNRSILYQPADRSVNDWLNKGLRRTEFMPFAPSTLAEYADECYIGVDGARDSARFMTITFGCTEQMRRTCPGVVHVDGTARPQLVVREQNPGYYRIIDEFRKITGVPSVINTSFNMHEEPIVCSPSDAIRAFRLGHLDYLAIGDFLVPSPEPIRHELRPMPGVELPAEASICSRPVLT